LLVTGPREIRQTAGKKSGGPSYSGEQLFDFGPLAGQRPDFPGEFARASLKLDVLLYVQRET
jgi:hypothetical protein